MYKNYDLCFYLGHFSTVNASGEEHVYQYCTSQWIELNVALPAFHTISYVGSLTTTLKLHFHPIPSVFEYLTVNESTVIKHTAGRFQRNIALDTNEKRLSISFTLRKFFGATDFCGYGGIRMFNHLNTSPSYHDQHSFLQAHVLYDNNNHNITAMSLKKSIYTPISTNDSFIFKRKFYLDFGTTYIVFYDFNSMWSIDLTLNVHSSEFNAIYNFEQTYCMHSVIVYIFKEFYINCKLIVFRLTQQVPLILQWPRESKNVVEHALGNIEFVWPGNMDLNVIHNHRNLRIFNTGNKLCTPNIMLFITAASNLIPLLLERNLQNRSVTEAESFNIERSLSNCLHMEQSSYAITLTPSREDDRCGYSHTAFEVNDHSAMGPNHKRIIDGCASHDVIMTKGMYVFYFMEPFFNILFQDKWVYYSLIISQGCYKRLAIKVYFKTTLAKASRMVHFEFTQDKSHYIWYNYGIVGVLMFHLERILLDCSAYIEMTSSPKMEDYQLYIQPFLRVSLTTNFLEQQYFTKKIYTLA